MVLHWKAPTESGCHLNQSKVLLSTDYLEDGAPINANAPSSTTVELWGVLSGESWTRGRDFFGRGESEGEESVSLNGSEEDFDESRCGDDDDAQVDGDRFWQEKEQLPFDGLLLTNEHVGQMLVQEVAVGGNHCILVTDAGHAFAYGSNCRGQLGLGDFSYEDHDPSSLALAAIPPLKGPGAQPQKIIGAACGGEHTLLLTRDVDGTAQQAYICGAWEACGLDSCQDRAIPTLLPFEHSVSAVAARVGCSCCAVAESDSQKGHLLYLWGEVDCCPCPDVLDQPTPCFRLERPVRTLKLGSAFGLALDTAGEVFAWGDSTYGELGNAPIEPRAPHSPLHAETSQLPVPGKVVLPRDPAPRAQDAATKKEGADDKPKAVIDIACGERFSLLLDEDGRLYAFGENLAGQCGVPEAVGSGHITGCAVQRVRFVPVERAVPHHDGTTSYQPESGARVFAGRWHSAMITRDHRLYVWGHPSNRKLGHAGFNHDGTEAGENPAVGGGRASQKNKARPPGVAVRSALRDAVRRPRLVFAMLHRRVRSVGLGDECTVIVSGDGGREHEEDPLMPGVASVVASDMSKASEMEFPRDLPDLEALETPAENSREEEEEGVCMQKEQEAPVPHETRYSL